MRARQCIWPNRVQHCFVYGLVFRFRLLSTPPLNDAVTFRYGQASVPVRKGLSPFCRCVLSGAHVPGTACQATIARSLRGLSDFGHFEKGDALKCPYTRFLKGGHAVLMVQKHEKSPFLADVRQPPTGQKPFAGRFTYFCRKLGVSSYFFSARQPRACPEQASARRAGTLQVAFTDTGTDRIFRVYHVAQPDDTALA